MRKMAIPKVDDGVKTGDDYENLQSFYQRCGVTEYVHRAKGGKVLRFEFGPLVTRLLAEGETVDDNKKARALSYAEIKKTSFINNLNSIVRYINYFIEYFDDDMELMTAYYYSMWTIMISKYELSPEEFVDHLRATYATKTMTQKLMNMIDYNVDKSMMKKADRKYDESIQLTEMHLKAIMGVSCIHRFIIPIVSQYIKARHADMAAAKCNDKDLYFMAMTAFLDMFDDVYDINLFNKLYHTATTRISKTKNEPLMWAHREKDGVSQESLAARLMEDMFVDISQKALFNKSAIIFIHVCFDRSIQNELNRKDKYEYSEMEMVASDNVNESVSKWDTWNQNHPGHSEKNKYESMATIEDFLKHALREVGINRKSKEAQDEYQYYRDHMPILDDIQLNLIFLYFSRRLGSYDVTEMIKRSDLNWFIMIMKRELFRHNYLYLPYFITGKLDPINTKKYNKKKLETMIRQHPSYDEYIDQYSAAYPLLNKDKVFSIIKALIGNKITIVDYDHQEFEGRTLSTINENTAIDEFMRLFIDI